MTGQDKPEKAVNPGNTIDQNTIGYSGEYQSLHGIRSETKQIQKWKMKEYIFDLAFFSF